MAWSNSKIFSAFIEDSFENTAALDIDTDALKNALFDNTITPSQTVATASTVYGAGVWASGGVLDASGWPAVGRPLAGVASSSAAGTYTFDATDTASANATTSLTNATGCLIYNDTTGDQGICFLYLGGANTIVSGTFTVVYNTSGLFTIAA